MAPNKRPLVDKPTSYGPADLSKQWHEYPSGLVDLSRPTAGLAESPDGPPLGSGSFDLETDGRTVRIAGKKAALIVIDMQNFFLSPKLRDHPNGLKAVDPLLAIVPKLRALGVHIIWVNWGLTPSTVSTLPTAIQRGFSRTKAATETDDGPAGGFGADLGPGLGKLLLRGEWNSELYGPLQDEYEKGRAAGTDVWIHKNRMSGIWGRGTDLEEHLTATGIDTLFFSGVNADQCVLGTVVDAYSLGYDVIAVEDTIATTSPSGAMENLLHNCMNSYGFVTDSKRILAARNED